MRPDRSHAAQQPNSACQGEGTFAYEAEILARPLDFDGLMPTCEVGQRRVPYTRLLQCQLVGPGAAVCLLVPEVT